jgi:hypothetical protein
MGVVRLFLWNLFDSQTTLDELRERLPELAPPSAWLSNAAGERFGLVLFGDPPEGLDEVERLVGRPADVAEEFEVL